MKSLHLAPHLSAQHLSDEAVAAFADDVLTGSARQRAGRHCQECPECRYAVAVQREAVWALRAAPAPALPTGLVDRLRALPVTTPLQTLPTALTPDGTTVLATTSRPGLFAPAAALVPGPPAPGAARSRHFAVAVVAAAAVGLLAAGSAQATSGSSAPEGPGLQPAHVVPADLHLTPVSATRH
ncbi:MAG: hypothetical protein EPN43_13305 [Jatrophihabitans sp.]|nr:MAG: hypothetical protein EPN43_13305 [Jatrophihabitans sp.]